MIEKRTYPRTRLALPATLYCDNNDQYYDRKVSNISPGGIYVNGMPCGRIGMRFDIAVHSRVDTATPAQRFPAEMVRTGSGGFALRFSSLDTRTRHLLENTIWPHWDGQDSFEGLIMVAAREDTHDLGSWLHLTSIVCNQYRRVCYHPAATDSRSKP